jgi:hypothetical protein
MTPARYGSLRASTVVPPGYRTAQSSAVTISLEKRSRAVVSQSAATVPYWLWAVVVTMASWVQRGSSKMRAAYGHSKAPNWLAQVLMALRRSFKAPVSLSITMAQYLRAEAMAMVITWARRGSLRASTVGVHGHNKEAS